MSVPAVSVILPVYNAEKYLPQAIESILTQTFTDFELLIINDGSTDASERIIMSVADKRVVYIKNERNKGLVFTLNTGIAAARGKYIARMDADDICLPQRLQKQFDWLERSTFTGVVGCHVAFIDEDEKVTGEWREDVETKSYAQIRRKMVWESCLAHPTAMLRAEVGKRYRYQEQQHHTEDYDLWLRLLADGFKIEKVPEKLLLYRVHPASITENFLRKTNPFFKLFHCERRFLQARISHGKWGWFETKILFTTIHNSVMGIAKEIKARVKG